MNIFPWNKIFVSGFVVEEKWFLCAKYGIWREDSTYDTMDQRSICLYLNRKGFSAHAIHDELVQIVGSDAVAYSTVTFYLRTSHWTAEKEEQHSNPLPVLSTTQFSRPLIKPSSRQCKNSKSPCAFQLQQFDDAWQDLLDLLSSICTGFPTAWQRCNGKFELIDQSNHSDA
jgi:hypothetical protein